jgi:hypothetical protein
MFINRGYIIMSDAETLCNEILKLDPSIRFAGVANNMGRLIAAKFRKGLQPLLTREEMESYTIKAVLRMKTREDYESELGKTIYTYALYEKVKRASIALDSASYSLLMVSFDTASDHEAIILDKILPILKRQRLRGAK